MKKIIALINTVTIFSLSAFAQNIGIGTKTPVNKLEVISAVVAPGTASLSATNKGWTGNAITAYSDSAGTTAIVGSSSKGTGIQGYNGSGNAIQALTNTGTALSVSSLTGNALTLSGKLKISGGNTNPVGGAVLTSDGVGNATWLRKPKIAFSADHSIPIVLPYNTFKKLDFSHNSYDLSNDFSGYTGTVSPTSNVFTAPVSGIYHFSAYFETIANAANFELVQIKIVKNYSSNALATALGFGYDPFQNFNCAQVAGDFHLNANDKVWIEVSQSTITTPSAQGINDQGRFCGHLVLAD